MSDQICPHCHSEPNTLKRMQEAQADKTKMHDFIRKLLSFIYMEMPAHPQTQKFVHQYFNEIQS
jgi:glutaredoxin